MHKRELKTSIRRLLFLAFESADLIDELQRRQLGADSGRSQQVREIEAHIYGLLGMSLDGR